MGMGPRAEWCDIVGEGGVRRVRLSEWAVVGGETMKRRGAVVAVGPERRDRGASVIVGEWECTRGFGLCVVWWLTSCSSALMLFGWDDDEVGEGGFWYYSLVCSSSG